MKLYKIFRWIKFFKCIVLLLIPQAHNLFPDKSGSGNPMLVIPRTEVPSWSFLFQGAINTGSDKQLIHEPG